MSGKMKVLIVAAATLVGMLLWEYGGPGARLGLILLATFFLVTEGYIWFLKLTNKR